VIKVSLNQARRMALNAQLLDGRAGLPTGKEGVVRAVQHLGYIQLDTISVIQRAHHHTLWTRFRQYDPADLTALHTRERRIFEYWGHALSYLPIDDFRFSLPRKLRARNPRGKWEKDRLALYGHYLRPVLEFVRNEGASASREVSQGLRHTLKRPQRHNPFKAALEMLFWRGELMIAERRSMERVYDLTERVLPAGVDTSMPDDAELGRFLVRRALRAYGLARKAEIVNHIHAADRTVIAAALTELSETGEVVGVALTGLEDDGYFALADDLQALTQLRRRKPRLELLSPFDNLIIQRDRVKRLFDFDYTLECYTPPAKRVHGYFVLPILWDESLVGRIDPKADRRSKTLLIRSIRLDREIADYDEFLTALAQKLTDFAHFNGCDNTVIMKTTPAGLVKDLRARFK
jgi:hypothetical protein